MPRRRLPEEVEKNIIRLRSEGYSRDEIAEKVGVSAGKVSSVLKEFSKTSRTEGVGPASRRYGVEGEIKALMALASELRSLNVSASESSSGARILAKLRKLGVDEVGLEEFLTKIYETSRDTGLNPEIIVESAKELHDLEEKTGLKYFELLEKNREASEEKARLEEEIRGLKGDLERSLKEKNVTIELLNEYASLRDSLKDYGMNIKELSRLKNVLENARESGYDSKTLVEAVSRVESLTKKGEELEKRITDLERRVDEANSFLEEKEPIIENAKSLEGLGFGKQRLESLKLTLERVLGKHGYKLDEALDKFFRDLEAYDEKVGFEKEVERLKTEVENMTKELEKERLELKNLEDRHSDLSSTISSIRELGAKNVRPEEIVQWSRILSKSGVKPEKLYASIEGYTGFQKLIDSTRSELRDLEKTIAERRGELEELEKMKASVEASVEALRDKYIKEITEIKETVASAITRLGEESISKIDGLSTKAEGTISGIQSNIKGESKKARDELEANSEKLKKAIEEIVEFTRKYGELKAEAGELGETLSLAKHIQAIVKYPSQSRNIPLDYDLQMMKAIITHCTVKDVNPYIGFGDLRKVGLLTLPLGWGLPLLDILEWAERGLRSAMGGRYG